MVRRSGVVAATVVLAGCGAPGPPPRPSSAPPAVVQAQGTHEYPAPPAPLERSASAAAAPQTAVRQFAERYINWNPETVTATLRRLARASVDQARSEMELEAAQVAGDAVLAQGGVANSGTVEAVAPLAGSGRRFVVVTRERTTATATSAYEGLRPAWHVTVASVREVGPGVWAVSGWQPQN